MSLITGFRNRNAFVQGLRKAGVRRFELNKRVILYREDDIRNFKRLKNDTD